MRYLIIRDGKLLEEVEQQSVRLRFSDARQTVGGDVELVPLTHGVVAYVNEEAGLIDLPEHLYVTHRRGHNVTLRGTVLLAGELVESGKDNGALLPVPQHLTIAMTPYSRNPQLRIMVIQP